jgi:hypothetical protein
MDNPKLVFGLKNAETDPGTKIMRVQITYLTNNQDVPEVSGAGLRPDTDAEIRRVDLLDATNQWMYYSRDFEVDPDSGKCPGEDLAPSDNYPDTRGRNKV